MKRWQSSWAMGRMVSHPAVLGELDRQARIRPELRRRDGLPIVTYRRTRVHLDRDAWEMLPAGGVLLMRVHPANKPPFALAFTPEELDAVFGEVRSTVSWDRERCYHFPNEPPAIASFRVTVSPPPNQLRVVDKVPLANSAVDLPTYAGFLWPTLVALRALDGVADIRQIDKAAIEQAGLTSDQRRRMHGSTNVTEAEYRLAWARTALKGMGAVQNVGRGRWRLTQLGRTMPSTEIPCRLDAYRAEQGARPRRRPAGAVRHRRISTPELSTEISRAPEILKELPPFARIFDGPLPDQIKTLEANLRTGGLSLIEAIFNNTFLLHPALVRERTPWYPSFARYSRTHYGNARKGAEASWQGQAVTLDDNSRAQLAWQNYSGRRLLRGAGYAIRHIWGHPWDPAAYTAGWNLAYMPNWAGMLTEDQHPHLLVQQTLRQASWDLFFSHDPVCTPLDFISDPGLDLVDLLGDQRVLLLAPGSPTAAQTARELPRVWADPPSSGTPVLAPNQS